MVSPINVLIVFFICFSLMGCSGTFHLSGKSVPNSSAENRFIGDGLSGLPTSETSTMHNENMDYDSSVKEDQDKLSRENTLNSKSSYGSDIVSLDGSSQIEDTHIVSPDNSLEYPGRQSNGDLSQDASAVTDEAEKPRRYGITHFALRRDEEYLRLVFDGEAIHEYVQFEVPEGKLLSGLFLASYYGEDDVAFYGIKAGCCDIWTAEPKIIPYLEAWSHIGPTNLGSNILSYSGNVQHTNTSPQAVLNTSREYTVLTPGTYVLLVQNANISGARYDFLFKLR